LSKSTESGRLAGTGGKGGGSTLAVCFGGSGFFSWEVQPESPKRMEETRRKEAKKRKVENAFMVGFLDD
jgi:hypothetical protein